MAAFPVFVPSVTRYLLVAHLVLLTAAAQTAPNKFWNAAISGKQKAVPGELLVKFRPAKLNRAAAVHAKLGSKKVRDFEAVKGLQLIRVAPHTSQAALATAYRSDPDVEYAEPNYVVKVSGTPNDPLVPQQWALQNSGGTHSQPGADISAFEAWNISTGSSSVVIAVIDTGVDYSHPDLAANIFRNTADCNTNGIDDDANGYVDDCHGINTYAATSDPMDDYGHGTHVAGIIGAVANNGVGVSGVNWSVKILPCKFINDQGYGSVAGAIECLSYVEKLKKRGVNIVATNNSWGGMENSTALAEAVAAQRDAGILFVASAGNEFSDNDSIPTYPASLGFSNIVTVASTTMQDRVSDFSNLGRYTVHVGAPGEDILSTLPGNSYGFASGTSMAAPHVSGVIGLLKAQNPARNWKQLKNLVLSGGDMIASLASTVTSRRLNALGSLSCSSSRVYSRLTPLQTPSSITKGKPLTLSYVDISCDAPNGPVSATVSETSQSIPLHDDGASPDQTAGDGVWTGNWVPTSIGRYTINVDGGDSFSVEVLTPYVYVGKASEYREFSGTSLDLDDDSFATISPPFLVQFGGARYDKLYVTSNGTISLSEVFKEYFNRTLPLQSSVMWDALWNQYQTTTLIAPWWDDLYPVKGTQQNVFWEIRGAAPNRELVIEWRNLGFFECHGDPDAVISFEVIFHENSEAIDFEYGKTTTPSCWYHTNGRSATIGLQTSGADGVTWSYNMPYAQDATALRFLLNTTALPTNPVPKIDTLVPNQAPTDSPDMTIVVNGSNFVPGSTVMWDGSRLGTVYVSTTELHAAITRSQLFLSKVAQITVVNPAPGGGTSSAMPFGVGGEPPYIASISPSSAPAGSGDFDLTIRGSGFNSGWRDISFNNQLRRITSFSTTEIHAKIFASDVAKAGTYKVFVWGFAGNISNQVDFTVTGAAPFRVFDARQGPGSGQRAMPTRFLGWTTRQAQTEEYTKWFSRDKSNVSDGAALQESAALTSATALPPGTPVPGIRLNPTIPTGFIPTGIVAADFNRDGKIDWAVANGGDSNIYLYLGRGDGTANPGKILPLRGVSPIQLIGADLRKIGRTDLVVAEVDSGTVGVLLDNGNGTFEPEMLHFGQGPVYSVAVADFNGDTIPDILYGIDSWTAETFTLPLSYLPGIGNGEFRRPVIFAPTSFYAALPHRMVVADLSDTGKPDIIVNDADFGTVVYETVDGKLKSGQVVGENFVDFAEYNSAVGDVDEDGCPDVVTMTTYSYARVSFGRCDSTFEVRPELQVWGLGEITFGLRLADVNGDGHLDIIAGGILLTNGGGGYGAADGGQVSVSFGNGRGWFDWPKLYPARQGIYDLAVADLNKDGHPDIITANQDADSCSILLNDGKGGFGPSFGQYIGHLREGQSGAINDPVGSPLLFDVNGDSRPDVVVLQYPRHGGDPYQLVTSLNQENGSFSIPYRSNVISSSYVTPSDYAIADFRRTGRSDLFIVTVEGKWFLAANQGDGTFVTLTQGSISDSFLHTALGDFDGDRVADIALAGAFGSVVLLHSNGDGTFTQKAAGQVSTTQTSFEIATIWAADLNHDGRLDLMLHTTNWVTEYGGRALLSMLGNGDGTFQTARVAIGGIAQPILGDVNGDGWLDVVETSDYIGSDARFQQTPLQNTVYLGQSDGTFSKSAVYDQYKSGTPLYSYGSLVSARFDSTYADYDGDGVKDIRALQRAPGAKYLQFLKGSTDGKFGPNFTRYLPSGTGLAAPLAYADFNGDGKADLLQYTGYTSSFLIFPAVEGKHLDANLLVNPVKGPNGTLRVTLAAASTVASLVSLTTSDAHIQMPSEITIPAGSVYADVPFIISSSFAMDRQFVITATLDGGKAEAFGTQVPNDSPVGFTGYATWDVVSGLPGGSTFPNTVHIFSKAGYSGHIVFGCDDLPETASCIFTTPEADLARGTYAESEFNVGLDANAAPGTYHFAVYATDGVSKERVPQTLIVSDFSLVQIKGYAELLPGGEGTIDIGVQTTGQMQSIVFSCKVADNAGNCTVNTNSTPQVRIQANNVPLGTYPIELTATAGGLTRRLTLSLHVVDVTATIEPVSVEFKVGSSTDVVLRLNAPDGLLDEAWINCTSSEYVSCYMHSSSVTFPNGAKTAEVKAMISGYSWASKSADSGLPLSRRRTLAFAFVCLLLPVGMFLWSARSKNAVLFTGMAIVMSFALMLSCGGGGGGGGPVNPPPSGGGSKQGVVKFTLSVPGFTKDLGSLKVTVTK